MFSAFAPAIAACLVASMIAIGLRDDSVLIQEYWQDGRPHYFVYNWTDTLVAISIRKHHSPARVGSESGWLGDAIAFWWVPPRASQSFPITPVIMPPHSPSTDRLLWPRIPDYLSVAVGGGKGGAITSPWTHDDLDWRNVATFGNLGQGGDSYPRYWLEQDSLVLRGGTHAVLTLVVKSYTGEVAFGDYASIAEFGRSNQNLMPRSGFPRRQYLAPAKVTSRTLSVRKENGLFVVDSSSVLDLEPSRTPGWHEVAVDVALPYVERLTPVMLFATWRDTNGGSGWMVRAILVEP